MQETSERIQVYNKSYAQAFYYPEDKVMKVVWLGNFNTEEYIELFNTLLKHAETNKVIRFISNTLKQGVVPIESRKYFETVVTPKSVELGMKRTAVITDANVFRKYYLNILIKASAKFGNPVKLVGTEKEAWDFVMAE
jgi:hypothetical protein